MSRCLKYDKNVPFFVELELYSIKIANVPYLNSSFSQYGNANQDDLWRHLTEVARQDGTLPPTLSVKDIMDTWTRQMHFPVVTINRHLNGSCTIYQVCSILFVFFIWMINYDPVLVFLDIHVARITLGYIQFSKTVNKA